MSDGPPRIAPSFVPEPVAIYMDNVADHLSEFAKTFGLTIYPYAQVAAGQEFWRHNLMGAFDGWEVMLQVVANEKSAYVFEGWLWIYIKFADLSSGLWVPLSWRKLSNMDAVLSCAQRAIEQLRLTCALRLPRPHAPRPVV